MELDNEMLPARILNSTLNRFFVDRSAPERSQPLTGSKVRLLRNARRAPASEAEAVVVELLPRTKDASLDSLISVVAEKLYRDEIRAGAWIVDLGLFSSGLFVPEARCLLETGNGELWQIY